MDFLQEGAREKSQLPVGGHEVVEDGLKGCVHPFVFSSGVCAFIRYGTVGRHYYFLFMWRVRLDRHAVRFSSINTSYSIRA